jgi:hypothetical protein
MTTSPPTPNRPVETWRLDSAGIWHDAWSLMKRHYTVLVLAGLILAGAGLFCFLAHKVIGDFVYIPSTLLFSPLYVGFLWIGVRLARGGSAAIGDLFEPFHRYWTVLAIVLLENAILYIIQIPSQLLIAQSHGNINSAPWCSATAYSLFILLPLELFFSIRLWCAPIVCLDERLGKPGFTMSLATSWAVGRQSFWPLLGMAIATGLMLLGTLLLAGVGLVLLGLPLYACVFGVVYVRIMDSVPRVRCRECGCDLSASQTLVCPVCGGAPGESSPIPEP